jgi:hypothetical protein
MIWEINRTCGIDRGDCDICGYSYVDYDCFDDITAAKERDEFYGAPRPKDKQEEKAWWDEMRSNPKYEEMVERWHERKQRQLMENLRDALEEGDY